MRYGHTETTSCDQYAEFTDSAKLPTELAHLNARSDGGGDQMSIVRWQRGQLVEFNAMLAVIVGTDADQWVPEGHVALWFGEPRTASESESKPGQLRPEVWTVPADLCTPAAEPDVRH
jgi:hypothetical protein